MRTDWRLSAAERNDARAALRLLAGSGLTLETAARLALRLNDTPSVSTPLDRAVDDFLRHCARKGLRPRTYSYYESNLLIFSNAFEGRALDDFDRPRLKQYLESLPVAPGTVRSRHRALRALFRWARRQDPPLVSRDPTDGIALDLGRSEHSVGILTPAQAGKAMHELPRVIQAAAALMLFAGLRPGELRDPQKPPLLWSHVDPAARIIRIPADVAKVRRARVLEELPENLWSWITPGPAEKPVSPMLSVQVIRRIQCALSLVGSWPPNACRHSFATYHLALHSDPGKTSLLLGHEGNPTMLHRHYRGLATKADAAKYFAITTAAGP